MTKLDFETKIQYLPSVGIKSAKKFEKLGIFTISDLIYYFPRAYADYTKISQIGRIPNELAEDWQNNNVFTIKGQILGIDNKKTRRRGFAVTEAVVADETGSLKVVWFNQPYLAKMFRNGGSVILNGKVSFDRFSNGYVMESPARVDKLRIMPIYSVTAGITSSYIAKLINVVLSTIDDIEEYLPQDILNKYDLLPIRETIINIHNPKDNQSLQSAMHRLAFDELFLISLQSALTKKERSFLRSPEIKVSRESIEDEITKLPYQLTGDQQKALNDIVSDLGEMQPMSRLINGDVGSGKTVVAALAAVAVAKAGYKTLVMAPTAILAAQHYETFCKLFGDKLKIGLYTADRKEMNLESGIWNLGDEEKLNSKFQIQNSDIIVGTQALIQKGIVIDDIGLVVVDEQHRFGVKQRAALQSVMGSRDGKALTPHFLSMTATPIPRTLHLTLFGDLDLSIIKEKPENRKEIKTRVVAPTNRQKAYDFVGNQIERGRQAFVICPLIEDKGSESKDNLFEEDRKSVISEYEKLGKVFPEFKIRSLHGKMKAKEKDEIMADFVSGQTQILVSTSVVEVGVDIPNASVMMIEDSERFGLSQLHQFRGRVGRGEYQSYCLLFSSSQSNKALERLNAMENHSDGFELAQIDLETRGPGSIFGTEQSGILDLKMASLSNIYLIESASKAASAVVASIDKYPLLKSKIGEFRVSKHLE